MQLVHLIGALSGTDAPQRLARLNALRKRLIQESAVSRIPSTPPPPRIGEIPKAILKVLETAHEPLHTTEIHRGVERLLGRPINYRSVKSCLSDGVRKRKPRFQRAAYGCYCLADQKMPNSHVPDLTLMTRGGGPPSRQSKGL